MTAVGDVPKGTRCATPCRPGAQRSWHHRDVDWNARVDLVLSAGSTLLIIEFMRPGLTINWDHLVRFERYVLILRERAEAKHRSSPV